MRGGHWTHRLDAKGPHRSMKVRWCDRLRQPTGRRERILKRSTSALLLEQSLASTNVSQKQRRTVGERRVMERDNIRTVEYSLLCRLFRKRVRKDFEDYYRQRGVKVAERKQSLMKRRRELLYVRTTVAAIKSKDKCRSGTLLLLLKACCLNSMDSNRYGINMEKILHGSVPVTCRRSRTSNPCCLGNKLSLCWSEQSLPNEGWKSTWRKQHQHQARFDQPVDTI